MAPTAKPISSVLAVAKTFKSAGTTSLLPLSTNNLCACKRQNKFELLKAATQFSGEFKFTGV